MPTLIPFLRTIKRHNKYRFAAPLLKMLLIWVAIRTIWVTELWFCSWTKSLEEEKKGKFCLVKVNSLSRLLCGFDFLRETRGLVKWLHGGYAVTYSQLKSNWGWIYCCCIRYSISHPTHHMFSICKVYVTLFIISWYGKILQILSLSTRVCFTFPWATEA